ncbi:hypothetical protein [Yinghuangia soli]|nr:hypothetical protein [Yinghuangia soli]
MAKRRKPVPCTLCGGKGFKEISQDGKVEKKSCGRCNGTGIVG